MDSGDPTHFHSGIKRLVKGALVIFITAVPEDTHTKNHQQNMP